MYTNEMMESIRRVEAAREANAVLEPRRMTAEAVSYTHLTLPTNTDV